MTNFLLGVLMGAFVMWLIMSIEIPINDEDEYWGDF